MYIHMFAFMMSVCFSHMYVASVLKNDNWPLGGGTTGLTGRTGLRPTKEETGISFHINSIVWKSIKINQIWGRISYDNNCPISCLDRSWVSRRTKVDCVFFWYNCNNDDLCRWTGRHSNNVMLFFFDICLLEEKEICVKAIGLLAAVAWNKRNKP